MPVIVVTILAFIVASIFMAIVEMIIDTTMIAFCEDCDSNDGHPVNAPDTLKEALGVLKKYQEEAEAAREKARQLNEYANTLDLTRCVWIQPIPLWPV
eukprot:1195983-Prorocentrum_minimum.AAC.2